MNNNSKLYKIFFLSTEACKCFVVCLSYESLFEYLNELQGVIASNDILDGKMLVDQLLVSGNAANRFLSIDE